MNAASRQSVVSGVVQTALYAGIAGCALSLLASQLGWPAAIRARLSAPRTIPGWQQVAAPAISTLGAVPDSSGAFTVLSLTHDAEVLVGSQAEGQGSMAPVYQLLDKRPQNARTPGDDRNPAVPPNLVARATCDAGWAAGFIATYPLTGPVRLLAGPEPALIHPGQPGFASVQRCAAVAFGPTGTHAIGTLPGYAASAATAIDDGCDVAGTAITADGAKSRAFAWTQFRMHDLGTLGGPSSEATAIGAGYVVGAASTRSGAWHAFRDRLPATPYPPDGRDVVYRTQDLGTLGGLRSWANATDSSGAIAGASQLANGQIHGFIWLPTHYSGTLTDRGRSCTLDYRGMVDLPPLPGDDSSEAFGVATSNRLDVVGMSMDSRTGRSRACIWEWGTVSDLNDLVTGPYSRKGDTWVLQQAVGMDRYGDIAGFGLLNGVRTAYMLTLHHTPVTGGAPIPAGLDVGPGHAQPRSYLALPGQPAAAELTRDAAVRITEDASASPAADARNASGSPTHGSPAAPAPHRAVAVRAVGAGLGGGAR